MRFRATSPQRASGGASGRLCAARFAGALVAMALLLSAHPALGQSQSPAPPADTALPAKAPSRPAPAPPAKHKIGPLNISASWRVRAEAWNWFEGGSGSSNYIFPHSLLRVALGQERDRLDWQVEAAQTLILGLPDTAVVAGPQGQLGLGGTYYASNGQRVHNANGFVKQAYIRFKKLGPASLRLGRFEFLDGTELRPADPALAAVLQTRVAQRLIGNFGWSAVGRSLDGVHLSYNPGKRNWTLLAARPTRGVFQADGMGSLDVDLYYGAFSAPVQSRAGAGALRLFSIGYIDHRTLVLKTDNRSQAFRSADHGRIEIATFGGNYAHVVNTAGAGKFDFLLWGALQTGSWGSLAHRAGAMVAEMGWQPPQDQLKPWLRFGYAYGSGDSNSSDSRHGTFFQVLPTPRPYARMPFYDMQNNEDAYAMLDLRPHAKLNFRTELHTLRLNQAADLWYLGGGAFQPRTFGYIGRPSNGSRSLANLWDMSADYQATRTFAVGMYYGRAWGKGVINSIYPRNRDGQFVYLETNFRY